MPEDTFEEKNSFRDYKIENLDDDLQSRLYAEIYYEPNNQDESGAISTMRIDSTIDGLNVVPENMQRKSEDEQHLQSEATKEPLACNDTLHIQNSSDSCISVEIQNSRDRSGRESNSMTHECNNTNNENSGDPSATDGKESSSKKHKASCNYIKCKHQENFQEDSTASLNDSLSEAVYSKFKVLQKREKQEMFMSKQADKDEEMSDSSDSEISIFEVPIPPKPKPLLIDLQDSDEDNADSIMDKNCLYRNRLKNADLETLLTATNCELGIIETSNSRQDTSSKTKSISKSPRNKNLDKSIQISTHAQQVREDIILNCTTVQKGVRNISEIRQLSKSTEIEQNLGDTSTGNTNENSKKRSPQNKTKGHSKNNSNLQQEAYAAWPGRKLRTGKTQQNMDASDTKCSRHNLKRRNQDSSDNMLAEMPCSDQIEVTGQKKQCDSEADSTHKHKRQCTVYRNNENDQSVMPQGGERRQKSSDEYFTPISEEMRDYYCNSTRGQENFDIGDLQRNMSKDPQKWAILDEDLMPRPSGRQRNRFWNVKCNNCHQDGHQRYDCTMPRRLPCCYICGTKGHIESRCLQAKMCSTCGKQQSTFRKTCEYCRVLYCTMCNSVGHKAKQCPDLWRRYHQTTDMSNMPQDPGNVMKPPNLLHCCNCTKRGHESSTCREYRWSQHFPTPAAVTNYTDGPAYVPVSTILPLGVTGSKTPTPQSRRSKQQATREHSELLANVDALPSCAKTNKMPIAQQATPQGIPQTEGTSELFSMIDEMLSPETEPRTQHGTSAINEKKFIDIVYSCGKFRDKNNENARMICRNLSTFSKALSPYGKITIINMQKRKITPVFLKALSEKEVEFDVKIGFTTCQRNHLMLQLIAMEECINLMYELLLHWINLPDDEKDYGVDITLPTNPTKMFNLLNSRMPQFKKMSFTCYNEHIGKVNDPRYLFQFINSEKAKLNRHKITKKEYSRLRTKVWRWQVKLLMIVNTEPEPNKYVHKLRDAMETLKSKRERTSEKLNTNIYLKFILLYNLLFVPHTPVGLFKTLRRFDNYTKKVAENSHCSPWMQQEPRKQVICGQENFALNNMNLSLLPATSCTSQGINSAEHSFAINTQHNMDNNIFLEEQVVNDVLPMISNATNYNCGEIMTIENSIAQISQVTTSFNAESDLKRNGEQLSVSNVNIDSNSNRFVGEQNVNAISVTRLTKAERRRLKKLAGKSNEANIYEKASKLITEARAFHLPHMTDTANDLQRMLNCQMITLKHIHVVEKLIKLEKKYQKNVNSYCNYLKA